MLATLPSPGSRLARDERRGIHPGIFAGLGAAALAIVLVAAVAVLPNLTSAATAGAEVVPAAQSLEIVEPAPVEATARDSYTATPGVDTYVAGGTNRDWASLVLLYGDWPVTDENVTVIMRWMRQENYEKTWWNRNNPLNNGWGSGGGGGLGSYPNLRVAAQNAAEGLHTHPGYVDIVAGFAASAPTEVTEAAIWASPWATSHYANGAHWHTTPTQVIKAPAEAW
jgi:hypothetical protein